MKCKDRCEYKHFDHTCCRECKDKECPNKCPWAMDGGECSRSQEEEE